MMSTSNNETQPSSRQISRRRLVPFLILGMIVFYSFGSEMVVLDRLQVETNVSVKNDTVRQRFKNESLTHNHTYSQNHTSKDSSIELPVTTNHNTSNHTTTNHNTSNHTTTIHNQNENNTLASNENNTLVSNDETNAASSQPDLTLLVMLSGQFGNNLCKILRGWGVARLALQEFGLKTRLVFAEQRNRKGGVMGKAKSTTQEVQSCFVSPTILRTEDFTLGNRLLDEGYFRELTTIPNFTLSHHDSTIHDIRNNLKRLSDYLQAHPEHTDETTNTTNTTIITQDKIVPRIMVRVNSLNVYPIVDELYDAIRETFVFDDQRCCGPALQQPPLPDETVLHLRNFATELRRESLRKSRGFEELDVHRLMQQVLGHLQPGDRLALAGRNLQVDSQNNQTQAYRIVSALQAMNLTLRFSPGTNGMQDFCFLKHTQYQLIGSSKSTYLALASYLAGPSLQLTRAYQYVSPELAETQLENFRFTVGDTWNHPELRQRFRFEEYFDDE